MDKIGLISSFIKLLITPAKGRQPGFLSLLNENVSTSLSALNAPELSWLKRSINEINLHGPENDPCWQFTSITLKTLICLCDTLIAIRNDESIKLNDAPSDILGARQLADVQTALQMVISLGISRNLMLGVGVALSSRTQFGHLLEVEVNANTDYEKHCMLYGTVTSLNSCCRNTLLANHILTKHLDDFLAALCQLCFAPLKQCPRSKEEPSETSDVSSISIEKQLLNEHIRSAQANGVQSLRILDEVIGRTYHPFVIRALLILQGPPKTSSNSFPPPNWLRRATQKLLNDIMTSKHGLISVIHAILDGGEHVELQTGYWQTYKVIGKLIANQLISSSEKCKINIASQVLELLDVVEGSNKRHFEMVVSSVISSTVSNKLGIAERYLLEPLLKLIISCSDQREFLSDEQGGLTKCIVNLHKVFVIGKCPDDEILSHLTPIIGLLFHVHAFLLQTISSLRLPLEELLSTYLKYIETSMAAQLLTEVIFAFVDGDPSKSTTLIWNPSLALELDDEAGLTIRKLDDRTSLKTNWLENDSHIVASVLNILSHLPNEEIVGKFFLSLLQGLSELVGTADSSSKSQLDLKDRKSDLIHVELENQQRKSRIRRSLLNLHLLSSLCENLDLEKSILQDKTQTFQFLNATLERGATLCSNQCEDIGLMESETLTMTMGILNLMLTAHMTNSKDVLARKQARTCIPHLQTLKSKHLSKSVTDMAEQLMIAIATNDTPRASYLNPTSFNLGKMSQFEEAWMDIFDSEVPIRGHAILSLTKLVSSKDKETINNGDRLLLAFQENLRHRDSYVYLMAVQGLAALADTFPDKIIPIFTEEFSDLTSSTATQRFDAETRMKLGEVLVKVIRMLGEMAPKYRDHLLNAILVTCRDEDPFVRASGLANLGEACKELRYALGTNIHEIFGCLSSYAKYDSSVQVRSAAVQVIVLLLRGLGKDALDALDDIMKNLYGLMKHVYRTDRDDVVKLQAQIALEELHVICSDFLFPKMALEKRIKIIEL